MKKFAPDFIKQHKRERFGWARDQVAKEHADGRRVILVSASADYMIPHLVRDMKFDAVLCSRMDASRPWKYEFLCWGPNKVLQWTNGPRKIKSFRVSCAPIRTAGLICR